MSVKFDAAAAEQLIEQMNIFCSNIEHDAVDILDLLELSGSWDDSQYHGFRNNVMEINKDLLQALTLQNEYLQLFQERVKELRG